VPIVVVLQAILNIPSLRDISSSSAYMAPSEIFSMLTTSTQTHITLKTYNFGPIVFFCFLRVFVPCFFCLYIRIAHKAFSFYNILYIHFHHCNHGLMFFFLFFVFNVLCSLSHTQDGAAGAFH